MSFLSFPSATQIMVGMLIAVGLILLYIAYLNLRNPVLVKVGLRNIPRRPAQSILIVVGLTLSTIIIVSALSIGDTLNHSVRSHTINAYGKIDEIIAPPLLSLLTSLGGDPTQLDEGDLEANAQAEDISRLMEGGLSTVLTFLEGGLPGVSMERYAQLRQEATEEPLIDAVTGSIIFPTIIRNVSTGQGEPLGFIFAVDNNYPDDFGLTTINGEPVRMEALQTGVGNIFAQASNLFALVGEGAERFGLGDFRISDAALATAAVGAALTAGAGEEGFDLSQVSIDVESIRALGIDTGFLEEQGIESLSLDSLGLTSDQLQALGVTTTTVNLNEMGTELGVDLGGATEFGTNLLGALNLNTLGTEIDRVLAQFGLQLRQGDVYLSRLGAEQLNARPGDIVEIYIGPLPIPFRVKAIVDQTGPMGALAPVVMLRLDEAQQLLFMHNKVNTILVSNQGDEFSGMEHTQAVSDRLRVLALDPDAVVAIEGILYQPDVQAVVSQEAARATDVMAEDFEGPAFILEMLEGFGVFAPFAAQVQRLPDILEAGDSEQLRELLADMSVREWLLGLNLPGDATPGLRNAMSQLNQFDVLDPLSKSTVVVAADVAGIAFSTIFSIFGALSILAGVILIFLIFVMMASERRSELGMARAVGLQRGHLVQMFITEGVVYDLVAAALGVVLGLGISYAMVGFIGQLFNTITGQLSGQSALFQVQFRAAPTSLVIAYCLGVLFTFIVVTIAAWRVSRLNIVSAIRDLPEPPPARHRTLWYRFWQAARGPILIVLGLALAFFYAGGDITLSQIAATLIVVGVSFGLGWWLALRAAREETIQRLAYSIMGFGLLAIWAVPWNQLLGMAGASPNISPWQMLGFIVSVPFIILGAILVIMFNADAWTWGVARLLGGIGALTPVVRTAVAYPLSTRFRTGMAMLLFAMIISTVTVMTMVIEATQSVVRPDDERTAGFEISVSGSLLSFFDPMRDLEAAIAAHPEFPQADVVAVGAVAENDERIETRLAEGGSTTSEWHRHALVGVSAGYIEQAAQVYSFQARAPGYADDAAVWEALRVRDDVAIVSPDWLQRMPGFMAEDATALPELPLQIRTASIEGGMGGDMEGGMEGAIHEVQVIGVLAQSSNAAGNGVQVRLPAYERIVASEVSPTFYVKVAPSADVHAVAAAIEREFAASALYSTVLAESFAQGQAVTRGILQLLQGFLALGLVVGIAALGVISTRTVVERRQQVGMLRAIGYQPRMIALSFLLESTFIAVTGLGVGAAAGIVLGRGIMDGVLSAVASDMVVATPWGQIGLILLGAYLFSLLTTLAPAYQASRIYPAEALRYE